MKTGVSCIIPFYNEGERIGSVLDTLANVKNISEILCVDDGSTDDGATMMQRKYPWANLIRLPKNLGKTLAIKEGLRYCKTNNILLFDGDLRDINKKQLETATTVFLKNPAINMIILRRINDPSINRLIRTDIVISGQRLVRKKDLETVLAKRPSRFQIELAINEYMVDHKKQFGWLPLEVRDTYKKDKFGFLLGVTRELIMYKELISFRGPWYYFRSLMTFCSNRIDK